MHSPGCINGLQPYVPLACLTPHLALCGDGWKPLLLFPSLSFPFQHPPHTSNCLSIQAFPSPHSSALLLPFPSVGFILLLIAQPMATLYGWNKARQNDRTSPSQTVFNRGRGLISNQTVKSRSLNAFAFFYTLPLDGGHHRNRWSDRTCGNNSSVCIKMSFFFGIPL